MMERYTYSCDKMLHLYQYNDLKMEEQNLRILTRIYNGERYLPSFLPPHDEVNVDNNSTPSGPGFSGFHDYDLDRSIDYDCIDLDPDFIHNYNAWLETEVFNAVDDDEEEKHLEEKQPQPFGCDTPIPPTPYPSNTDNGQQFTPEELTFEINKLYVQELNAEFKPAAPLTTTTSPSSTSTNIKKLEEDWESPPAPKKLTPLFRYDGNEGSMTYLRSPLIQQQEQVVEEQRDENWQMQAQDELISRLVFVEEKSAEKWLSNNNKHGNNSAYHFKLFDLFDQELYSSSEYITSSDDYDENDYLHYTSYDDDDQKEQDVY